MELLCQGAHPSSKTAHSVGPHLPSVSMSLFKGLMPLALNASVLLLHQMQSLYSPSPPQTFPLSLFLLTAKPL